MAREDLHFRLRIPDELKAKVQAAAEANHRSMTAEIVARLEQTFEMTLTSRASSDGERFYMSKEEVEEIVDRSFDRLKRDLVEAGVDLPQKKN